MKLIPYVSIICSLTLAMALGCSKDEPAAVPPTPETQAIQVEPASAAAKVDDAETEDPPTPVPTAPAPTPVPTPVPTPAVPEPTVEAAESAVETADEAEEQQEVPDTPTPTPTATPQTETTDASTETPEEDASAQEEVDDTPTPVPPTPTPAPTETPAPEPTSEPTPVPVPISEPGDLSLKVEGDLTVYGIDEGDESGSALAVGDLNGDGSDDLVIGAYNASPGGKFQAGESYILFGPLARRTQLTSASDVTLNGVESGGFSGRGVAVGDINGDGSHDVVVGAPNVGAGTVYVLFGPFDAGTVDLSDADITITGIEDKDFAGNGVAARDLNGDDSDDLIIGAPGAGPAGKVYVVFGPVESGSLELSSVANLTLNGTVEGGDAGTSVAAGDLNNDGEHDLVVGAPYASSQGETYVAFGPFEGGTLELANASITLVGRGTRVGESDRAGTSVGSGDVNNDGVDDLIVGAPYSATIANSYGGETYVVFGPLEPGIITPCSCNNLIAYGTRPLSGTGSAVGDMNGDGVPDLVIGAGLDAGLGPVAGRTMVLLGGGATAER